MFSHEDRELIDYIPTVLSGVSQYRALSFSEQPEVARVFKGAESALDNQFVIACTEYGISRWEGLLGVVPKATASLEERRIVVLSRLAEELPFTLSRLRLMLNALCKGDYKMELRHLEYELLLEFDFEKIRNFNAIMELLKRVVPANISIKNLFTYEAPQAHAYTGAFAAIGATIVVHPYNVGEYTTRAEVAPRVFVKMGMEIRNLIREDFNE